MKHGRQKGSKGWRFQPRSKGGLGYFSEDVVNAHGADDCETGSRSLAGFTAILDDEPYEPEYYFALLCENGLDLYNDEACALAAETLQLEHEAYLLRGHGKGKGHGGFQPHRHFDISGSVSLQERKARLAQLKSRTECRRCGAKGHWSGDAACPKGCQRSLQTPVRLLPEQACPQRAASQVARARSHVWLTFPQWL